MGLIGVKGARRSGHEGPAAAALALVPTPAPPASPLLADADNIYLVMELCEGGDLFKAMLLRGGTLDEHYVCVEVGHQGAQGQGVEGGAGVQCRAQSGPLFARVGQCWSRAAPWHACVARRSSPRCCACSRSFTP